MLYRGFLIYQVNIVIYEATRGNLTMHESSLTLLKGRIDRYWSQYDPG